MKGCLMEVCLIAEKFLAIHKPVKRLVGEGKEKYEE